MVNFHVQIHTYDEPSVSNFIYVREATYQNCTIDLTKRKYNRLSAVSCNAYSIIDRFENNHEGRRINTRRYIQFCDNRL